MKTTSLPALASLVRYLILESTTKAGSGHPSSCLSAADIMVTLMFGGFFRFDLHNPDYPGNDRLLFSKGHAAPLLYSLYAAAGAIGEDELFSLRQFGSRLEGHPTILFPYTEAATGSLGQGLGIGVGMALNAKIEKLPYTTFVLLGDSEMAEGSVWESVQLAAYYKLDNLIGILDMSRLGQRGETMYGHNAQAYVKRVGAFGWKTLVVDGHNFKQIAAAYAKALKTKKTPTMIVAKTVKGKGVSLIENKDGWHGKTLSVEECTKAVQALGMIEKTMRGKIARPPTVTTKPVAAQQGGPRFTDYKPGDMIATRKAYGNGLVDLFAVYPKMVVLDAEVSNSTYADIFKKKYPDKFFEMFIAEQNMVSTALGLARRGKIPFVSTFAAFLTRAHDQIRMCQYSEANIKFVGSHAGVSIGEDGASQMGLEDIALFRAVHNSVVLYPGDAVATERLVAAAAAHNGMVYIRTTRKDTSVIYNSTEQFAIGGSKVVRSSGNDAVTIVTAGVTLFEALAACDELKKQNINVRVIDLYSIKPLDLATLEKAAKETRALITVEDHYAEGGLGEAVQGAVGHFNTPVYSMAVRKMPRSGKPEELVRYEEIDREAIMGKIDELL